jgi:hypothetical protein
VHHDHVRTFRVERAERLVEEQYAGLRIERARERHALGLAVGELRRPRALQRAELDQLVESSHASADARLVPPPHGRREGDVLEHVHLAEEGVVLEHEADVTLAHGHVRRPRRRSGRCRSPASGAPR